MQKQGKQHASKSQTNRMNGHETNFHKIMLQILQDVMWFPKKWFQFTSYNFFGINMYKEIIEKSTPKNIISEIIWMSYIRRKSYIFLKI